MGRRVALSVGFALLLPLVLPAALRADDGDAPGEVAKTDPAWWLARAQAKALDIDPPDARAASLVSVAAGWIEAGHEKEAVAALGRALEFASSCDGCFAKVQRLVDVADLQAKAGDADGASRTLGLAIEAAEGLDEMFGVSGLALVGSALAERGDERAGKVLARAEAQAEKLEGTDWVIVLPEVADAFASAGDFAHADALAKRLAKGRGKTEAGLLDSARHHADQAEGSIALRQAASGDAKGAIARARAIEDPESRARVLADIAASIDDPAARLDARLAALEASRQVTYPDARVLLLADVARALARSGDLAPAKEAMGNAQAGVGEIADGKRLLDALFAMAGGWHAVGDAKRTDETLGAAKQLIEERLPVRQGDVAWAALARTAAGVGRFDTAFDAVGHVGDATGAALALASIGEAAARASNAAALGDAATNLQALVDAWPEDIRRAKDTAQGRLALLLARQGRLDDAAARLDAIASPYQTVLAATGIARALPR